jgi:hypothetical protein
VEVVILLSLAQHSIMNVSSQASLAATALGFSVIRTYLAAMTAVIGVLAPARTVLRQRQRAVMTNTYELDATPA